MGDSSHDHPTAPQRALHAGLECPRHREGAQLAVDAVILDLEDSVAPEAKEAARKQVSEAVSAGGFGPREVIVRINGLDTAWWLRRSQRGRPRQARCGPGPEGRPRDQLEDVAERLVDIGADHKMRVWAMMETPLAMLHADAIAAAAKDVETRLAAFVMGTNDLAKDTRAKLVPGRAAMMPVADDLHRRGARLRARHHRRRLQRSRQCRRLRAGMRAGSRHGLRRQDAHPPEPGRALQRRVLAESPTRWRRRKKIIAAFDLPENAGKGVVQLDGRMVERLHADMARRTVAIAEAIAGRAI